MALLALFFLREWAHQPSLLVGIVLVVMGVIFAHWRAEDEAPDHPSDEVSDPFGMTLAGWCRLMRIGTNIVLIVEDEEDFHRLMGTLQAKG